MAVTKTHPIKSTLKAAIDYILNPEKTDGKLLASSFGCGLETADIEFAWTREAAGDRGTHLGRHLIQSFAVGETTPEEAHKIGMELAGAVLGGKYEFVLTTHVDKDHLHNHLIFNAVSFVDYKKYHSNKQSYHFIRRTSDRICKEHGLSVVVPGQDKGKSYAEYTAEKQGTSYKAKLKTAMLKKIVLFPISLFVAFLALMARWLLTLSSYVVAPLMLYIFGCGIYTAYRQTWNQFFILLVAEFICFILFFGATAITEGIGRFSEWLAEL